MSPEDRRGALPRGQETILLVEDELALLNLAKQMLEVQGFPVLTASSPSEAIRLAKTYSGPIHLLVTDIIMPEMNGYELAGKLQALIPDLKCLFTSGYTRDVFERHGMPEDGVNFLAKPFSMQDFSRKVRDTLDEP